MSHPFHHALSSVKKWGGKPEDYLPIHNWFDETKAHFTDPRHRAMRHHSEGIFLCEQIFGVTITNSKGHKVPARILGEQHVMEDLGWIPSMADWLRCIKPEAWMNRVPGERIRNVKLKKPIQTTNATQTTKISIKL